MAKRKVLLQWIGHSDLRAMAASLSPARRDALMAKLGGVQPKARDLGPTKTLLTTQAFEEIRLLSNYTAEWGKWFVDWLGIRADLVQVGLDKPTDYAAIYRMANDELAKLRERKGWPDTQLCLHLSPGTPAMAAVWLLLGKTRYPATFYETYGGRSWITEVPFDLTVDVIPEIFRVPDAHLQYLASESPRQIEGFQDIVGESAAIREAVGRAKRAAMRGVSVLLLGESGTGKELFARAIHRASPRRDKPLVAINCAALSKTLLESELFGHTKGAFTGASHEHQGAFEQAHGGTLFLDEIGDCELEIQAKLLRALQPISSEGPCIRAVRPLGARTDRKVDVRVIAATNRDLHRAIRDGQFRDDLYYRFAAITITLPPLRDRKSDIPEIAERLLAQINRQFAAEEPGYEHKRLSAAAKAFVKRHDWPGNVRRLQNVLLQAAVMSESSELGVSDLKASLGELPSDPIADASILERPLGDGFDLDEYLNGIRALYLRRAMREAGGVKATAARLLGMEHYQTLDHQLKRFEVTDDWNT